MAQPVGVAGGPPRPPKPKPTPVSRGVSAVVAPVASAAHTVSHAVAVQHPARHGGSDVQSSGGDYGSSQANAYKRTPAYAKAVVSVFQHQSPQQQQAILRGAQQRPSLEGRIILSHLAQQRGAATGGGLGPATIAPTGEISRAASQGFKLASGTIQVPRILSKIAGHTAEDLWNLAPGTVEGLYGVGKDIVTGHEGNAFHALVDPYVQLAEHPVSTFVNHPLNTGLMLLGPKAIVGKGIGAVARSGALGEGAAEAASTARAPLHIGTVAGEPSPITEARSYSNDVFNKAIQRAREKSLQSKGKNPNVARESIVPQAIQQATHTGSVAKLQRIADEMTSTRQQAGRAERARTIADMNRAAPPKEVRNVVSHIAQSVVNKPEDLITEANRIRAALTGKRTVGEIAARKQIRDLETAAKNPHLMDQAFQAGNAIRDQLNAQDAYSIRKGLIDPEQALRSKLFPYAQAHMGARYDFKKGELVRPNGEPLSNDAILAHMKANGVPEPAYVGHYPNKVAPHRFYAAYKLARGTLARQKRTGEAFRTGAYDHSFEGLVGQVATRAEAVTKASLHDRVVSRLGILKPKQLQNEQLQQLAQKVAAGGISKEAAAKEAASIKTGMFTPREAQQFAHAAMTDDHGNVVPGALELTPVSAANANVLGLVKDLQNPSELNNLSSIEIRALSHAIDDAATRTDQTRNVVMVPTAAVQRFQQQFQRTDGLLRTVGRATQQFRRTVLPYSTHWMLQIGSEASLRGLIAGALDPRYWSDGRRLMTRLETTEPGRAALMEMVNATFYNAKDPLAIHNPNPGAISSAAHAFPPTRALLAAHNRYADTIGHAMYTLEHNFRLAGLGKLAHKEVAEFSRAWQHSVRLQGQSIEELARRLETNPALVAKFGRSIDDTFGKYNKFSPKVRAAIQSVAPFLPWYLNAAKYVFWHLPAHHPVTSAVLASLRQTVNQDIKDGKQAPLNVYAMQELARISPFGIFSPSSTKPSASAFAEGEDVVPGAILPQLEGSLYNLAGLNSFGEGPLKGPSGDVKAKSNAAIGAAGENLLEAFLPLARYVREVQEGGQPAYGTSTVLHPQPEQGKGKTSVANRILNPFYSFQRAKGSGPAYGAAAASSAAGSGGWGGSSSSSGGWGGSSSSSGGWG